MSKRNRSSFDDKKKSSKSRPSGPLETDPQVPEADIETAVEAAIQACQAFIEDWSSRDADRILPRDLWHYTDVNGLNGILHDGIWLTDAAYLNDAGELRDFEDFILDGLSEIVEDLQQDENEYLAFRAIGAMEALNEMGYRPRIASFSQTPDDLNQWRMYGANGLGYAVILDRERLAELASAKKFEVLDVTYFSEQDQRPDIVATILSQYRSLLGDAREDTDERWITAQIFLQHLVSTYAPMHKSGVYASENEVRLVHSGEAGDFRERGSFLHENVSTRVSGTKLVPFTILDVRESITEIVVGPRLTQDQVLATRGVEYALDKIGMMDVPVTLSRHYTYRG